MQSHARAREKQRMKRSRGKRTHRGFCSTARSIQPALNAAHISQIKAEPSLVPGLPACAQGPGETNSTGAFSLQRFALLLLAAEPARRDGKVSESSEGDITQVFWC